MSNPKTQTILYAIRRIVQGLRVSSRAIESDFGISGAQLFVLQKLAGETGLSINEVAERTFTHQSSVSVVISKLLDRGLVTRTTSQQDGRRQVVAISASGRSFLRRAPATVQERLVAAIGTMSTEDQTHLGNLLESLVLNAGLANEKPEMFFEHRE